MDPFHHSFVPVPLIQVHQLTKIYREKTILKSVDLQILPHELTVIIGRSGCGKSTLLRCMQGLEPFEKGQLQCEDLILRGTAELSGASGSGALSQFERAARPLRKKFGMVFQSFNLFPHLTVLENITKAPVVVKGVSTEEAEATARALLEKVGLPQYAGHYPQQLSGGQQQRVAIARALAMAPDVMFYDEPTSALDPLLVGEVFQVMRKIAEEGMTQVVVTHEMRFTQEIADRVVYMEEGCVVEVSSPREARGQASLSSRTQRYLNREINLS